MESKERSIEYYITDEGKVPFKDWFSSLRDKRASATVAVRIRRAGLGNFGKHKSVGNGIIELKVKYGGGLRIYFSLVEDKIILLLVGGDKSSQSKDIKRAKEYLNDWRVKDE